MIERKPELTVRIPNKKPVYLFNEASYPTFRVTTEGVITETVVDSFVNEISEHLWDGEKLDLRHIPFIKPLEIKVEGTPSRDKQSPATYKNLLITANYNNLKINGLNADEGYVQTLNPSVDHNTFPQALYFDFQQHVKAVTGRKQLPGEKSLFELAIVV